MSVVIDKIDKDGYDYVRRTIMNVTKLLVMDVDGTLTDGKIYMGQEGECIKAFDIKDGAGIVLILPQNGIVPVIITARKSQILEKRCKELKIQELHQDCFFKLDKLYEIIGRYEIGLDSVAYVGDDLPDIPCMEAVKKAGGVVLCPADAIPEIKALADYVSGCKAGEGAIRDCIHYLVKKKHEDDIKKRICKAVDLIISGQYEDKPIGVLPDGNIYTIQEYVTKSEADCIIETHRHHIDIQYIIEGNEEFNTYGTHCLTSTGEYNNKKDAEYWNDGIVATRSVLIPGSLIVVMSNQPHKGAILHKQSEKVRKLVCKIEV